MGISPKIGLIGVALAGCQELYFCNLSKSGKEIDQELVKKSERIGPSNIS
jgi:hypothetical protein